MRSPIERIAHAITLESECADKCPFGRYEANGDFSITGRELDAWNDLVMAAAKTALESLLHPPPEEETERRRLEGEGVLVGKEEAGQ